MKTILILIAIALFLPICALASSATATVGDQVTIFVQADGTPPLAYQWFKDGTAIAGATTSTYTIAAAALADAGTYTAKVSNSAGATVSDNAVLTVSPLILPPTKATTTMSTKKGAALL
jgi:hypothetical protein